MQLTVLRMYFSLMQEFYDATEIQLLELTGEEYEDCLDTLANIRAHMFFTKNLIKEFENV